MIAVPLINWQPIGAMPSDRKDERRMLGWSEEEAGAFTMRWQSGPFIYDGWYLDPHHYEDVPVQPSYWADINPPA